MKKFILFLTLFATCNLFAQTDTIDNKIVSNYSYQLLGGKHYYVITTTQSDSDSIETTQRIQFPTRARVIQFAKNQADQADSLAQELKMQIDQKVEYLRNMDEQIQKYNEMLTKEFTKTRQELRALRTQRKLIIESKSKNNNVK